MMCIVRKAADDARLAHPAIVVTLLVTRVWPQDADHLTAKVAVVAVDMFRIYAVGSEQRIDEEVDAPARNVERYVLLLAVGKQLSEAAADLGVVYREPNDRFFVCRRQGGEHRADTLADGDVASDNLLDRVLPAWGIKVLHDGYDVVVLGDRPVKVAEDHRLLV